MEMMTEDKPTVKIKRKQGGQPGNQNARIHGFYSKVLDADEQKDYEEAKNIVGLKDEIALLRVKIKSVMRHDGQNMKLLAIALATMCRLVAEDRQIARDDREGLKEAVGDIIHDLDLPQEIKEEMLGP